MPSIPLKLLIPILLVGSANIALNVFSKAAAEHGRTLGGAVKSPYFVLALLAGSASFISLLYVYQARVGLASAVLLMGAVSILGGALVGIVFFGNRLHPTEVGLLLAIMVLFCARWLLAK